jgi:hypothetical protein
LAEKGKGATGAILPNKVLLPTSLLTRNRQQQVAARAGLSGEDADDDWWEYDALTLVEKTPMMFGASMICESMLR